MLRASARRAALPILCVLAGGAVGFVVRDRMPVEDGCRTFTEVRDDGFRYVSPLLECDAGRRVLRSRELKPFEEKVEDFIRERSQQLEGERVAVYFRELNDGIWFSVNEELSFSPASMRKVPMLIAILKEAERTPDLLSRRIVANLQQDHDARQNVKPSRPLEPGRTYAVGDLLTQMIVQSDNNAFMLVSGIVDRRELEKVYALLSMRPPAQSQEESPFSVITYSSFFRILYNGTYLTKEMSDLALEQLAQVEFRSGIVAGVPKTVVVAHKFGERSDNASGEKQLHDCGIVYYPRHPYLLCVMTRGPSFEKLADTIASVSKIIFAEIESRGSATADPAAGVLRTGERR